MYKKSVNLQRMENIETFKPLDEIITSSDFDVLLDSDFLSSDDNDAFNENEEINYNKAIKMKKLLQKCPKFMNNTSTTSDNTKCISSEKTMKTNKRGRYNPTIHIPKVPKHDIRRYFANMFMNTLNSGEFGHSQTFFQTFMTSKCQFITTTPKLPDMLKIPTCVVGSGPHLFAHYFLGLHVMFPDIIMTMNSNKVITYRNSDYTKIVADLVVDYTKTVHIPDNLWVPPLHLLSDIYSSNSLEEVTQVLSRTKLENKVENKVECSDHTTDNDISRMTSNRATPNATITTTSTTDTANTEDDGHLSQIQIIHNKREFQEHQTSTLTSTMSTATTTTENDHIPKYIPMQYIQYLQEAAVPLEKTISFRASAQLEFILDADNHIRHIELRSTLL